MSMEKYPDDPNRRRRDDCRRPSAARGWRWLPMRLIAPLLVLLLPGCRALSPGEFAGASPRFEPVAYFTGRTVSTGVFENRSGEPVRRFTTVADGRREPDGSLRLDQTFTYDDGTTQQRHWRIRRLDGGGRYEATANDVVGVGTGEARGNAFRWEYTVALRPGNPLMNVRLKQWMYLQPDGRTVLNRGDLRLLAGLVPVAQVSESFRRESRP